mgnify:CR=1 FL=1
MMRKLELQGLLGNLDHSGEGGRIVHSHVGEHLAIELDAGLLEAVHEAGVVDVVALAGCGNSGKRRFRRHGLLQ